MNIRWYKNGKLSTPKYDEFKSLTSDLQIGDTVKILDGTLYYNDTGSENLHRFNQDNWKALVGNVRQSIIDIKYIDTPYYVGNVIMVRNHWPWFQTTNVVLLSKNEK